MMTIRSRSVGKFITSNLSPPCNVQLIVQLNGQEKNNIKQYSTLDDDDDDESVTTHRATQQIVY